DSKAARFELPGVHVSPLSPSETSVAFDLMLDVAHEGDGLEFAFDYALDVFDTTTVERLQAHYLELLAQVVERPEQRVLSLSLSGEPVGAPERHYVFHSALERFAEQCQAHAQRVAVSGPDSELSYAALATWSDQIARRLSELRIRREEHVALCLERSPAL